MTHFKIFDNGGETADRYTLINKDREIFGFDNNPFSPTGFGQYCGDVPKNMTTFEHLGTEIKLKDLSGEAQKFVNERI